MIARRPPWHQQGERLHYAHAGGYCRAVDRFSASFAPVIIDRQLESAKRSSKTKGRGFSRALVSSPSHGMDRELERIAKRTEEERVRDAACGDADLEIFGVLTGVVFLEKRIADWNFIR